MKLTAIGSYTSQLTRWPLLFPVNVYLVAEEDGLTLIDTAVGGSANQILAAAGEIGTSIVRIALTHAHGDHIGSLDELHRLLPEAEILTSQRSARFLSGDLEPDPQEGKLRGSFTAISARPTTIVSPGDRIGSLEVIAAPGHSPDQIAFLDTRDHILIAGDAFQTRGGTAVSGTVRPLFPFPAMATWNKEVALQTARELRRLSPRHLAIGHGPVLTEPNTEMDRAIAVADRALTRGVRHAG